jgi:hypothetical protein
MLLPHIIITKKDKFKDLYRDIHDFIYVQGMFAGMYPNIDAHLSEERKEEYQILKEVFYDRSKERNDVFYDAYIVKAVQFLKDILELVPNPKTFQNGREMESFESRYSFVTNPEHDGAHLGSLCEVVISNRVIQKHSAQDVKHIYGSVKLFHSDYYDFTEWLTKMGAGRYTIDGFRFDVEVSKYTEETHVNQISVYRKDVEKHPIMNFIVRNEEPIDDTPEPNCSRCRDGGCPSCEPQRFI